MKANANSMSSFNTNQERARRRRNRNVTMVLFGIVLLFLLCHIGEVAISIYELADVLDGERSMFPQWASNTIILNHLLIVINSSLNFVIYCKDVVFRYVHLQTSFSSFGESFNPVMKNQRTKKGNILVFVDVQLDTRLSEVNTA